MRIPARCLNPRCGHVFPSSFAGGEGSVTVGCITDCPRCGYSAEVASGEVGPGATFSAFDAESAKTVLKVEQYIRLREVAQRAKRGEIGRDEAVAAAREIAPTAGRAVSNAFSEKNLTLFIMVLSFLILVLTTAGDEADHEEIMAALNGQRAVQEQLLEVAKQQQATNAQLAKTLSSLGLTMKLAHDVTKPRRVHRGNRHERRAAGSRARRGDVPITRD